MNKYEVTFSKDYRELKEIANKGNSYFANKFKSDEYKDGLKFCKKFGGCKLSLAEAEVIIDSIGAFVFNGNEIEIYNDYRE